MRLASTLAVLVFGVLNAPVAWGHGGGLNAEGCHNERRTGGYPS